MVSRCSLILKYDVSGFSVVASTFSVAAYNSSVTYKFGLHTGNKSMQLKSTSGMDWKPNISCMYFFVYVTSVHIFLSLNNESFTVCCIASLVVMDWSASYDGKMMPKSTGVISNIGIRHN